jgi:SulP family sulfate permease
MGLEIVGNIPSGLPQLGLPDIGFGDFLDVLGPAVGVMLVGFAEGLGAAKTYAAKEGYEIEPNRELFGLGIANLGTGFASGMVVNGSLSKTAVNGSAGAKSQFSSLTAAVLTVLTLLFLTGLFEKLPEAVLAAIVIAAVIELIDFKALKHLWKVQNGRIAKAYQLTARVDFVAALAALLGVLLFDTLPGLILGIAISLALLIGRTSRPHIATLAPISDAPGTPWVDVNRNPDYRPVPSTLVVRVESSLLFPNAEYVRETIKQRADEVDDLRLVVLDGGTSPTVDVTAAAALVQLRKDLQAEGAELVLAQSVGRVRDMLHTAESGDEPPVYGTIAEALAAADIQQTVSRSPSSGESDDAGEKQG